MAAAPHSFLRSIGNALHIAPSAGFSRPSRSAASNQEFSLKIFEEKLAARFQSLVCKDETQILSLEWLKSATEVLIATNVDAQAFIPEVQIPLLKRDEGWMKDYLEYSSLVLEICNIIGKDIMGMEKILMLVKLSIHMLNSKSLSDRSELSRAKDSLSECFEALKSHGSLEMNRKKHLLLENMAKSFLCAKSHLLNKSAFTKVCFAAKLTTIAICSIVVTALSGENFLLMDLSLPESFAWSRPFISLQTTIKIIIIEKMEKGLSFIPELQNLELCLKKFKALLTECENKDTMTILMKSSERTSPSVGDLTEGLEAFENSLTSMEGKMQRFFHLMIASRNALLDKFKRE